jgi:hypothetical protein
MISYRRHSLSILLIVFVVFALPSAAQATGTLALELLNRIRAQDFGGAAVLFHYPQSQSQAERNADRAGVIRWLQTLSEQLGPLQSFKPHESSPEGILSVSIAAGDVAYWASRGPLQTVTYAFSASWMNAPDTRLTVHVMKDEKGWAVHSLHCGVLASRPDAQPLMMSLTRKLMPQVR